MAEYIEREAAIDAIMKVYVRTAGYKARERVFEAEEAVHRLPVADVAPVVHGRCERIGIKGRKGLPIYPCCSACGIVSAALRSEWEGLRGAWKYCPNCGAKMDGDSNAKAD